MKKPILLKIAQIALHVLGWPLLLALVFVFNRKVIAGGSMYGIAVFVCAIVTAAMALVYYLTYFLVRTKKKRSIRNQHIIIAIVAVCVLSGFWMLLDAAIPGPLETATSSTLRWEDLSDNWGARAEVQEGLLRDYVTINFGLGRLTSPNGETLDDYIKQGPNGNEELHALLDADFHSIDSDGYASYVGPSIDYAQSDRMTIPVLLHLFLDDRSDVQGANSAYAKENKLDALRIPVPYYNVYNEGETEPAAEDVRIYHGYDQGEATFLVTDQDLNVLDTFNTKQLAVISIANGKWTLVTKVIDYDNTATETVTQYGSKQEAVGAAVSQGFTTYFVGGYRQATVNWHVLDMMGTAMEMSPFSKQLLETKIADAMSGIAAEGMVANALNGLQTTLAEKDVECVADIFQLDLVPDAMALVADMVAEDEVLGSPLYISFDSESGTLALTPSNSHRGTLGYMETAWLQNQGLLYIIVSLFSLRTLFYIYGPIMAIISILLGAIREQLAKSKSVAATTAETAAAAKAGDLDLVEDDEPVAASGHDIGDLDVV